MKEIGQLTNLSMAGIILLFSLTDYISCSVFLNIFNPIPICMCHAHNFMGGNVDPITTLLLLQHGMLTNFYLKGSLSDNNKKKIRSYLEN